MVSNISEDELSNKVDQNRDFNEYVIDQLEYIEDRIITLDMLMQIVVAEFADRSPSMRITFEDLLWQAENKFMTAENDCDVQQRVLNHFELMKIFFEDANKFLSNPIKARRYGGARKGRMGNS